LKPIISRFCEIFVPLPIINGIETNLYNYTLNKHHQINKEEKVSLQKIKKIIYSEKPFYDIINNLYDKGYCALDLIKLYEHTDLKILNIESRKKYENLIQFQQIKKEFRHEKLCMANILNKILNTFDEPLENISS
jgi:uncharacterized protein YebE (UPF0316 family)